MKHFTLQDLAKSKCAHLNDHIINPPKKPKYRNTKTVINDIKFDSKKEAEYYKKLLILQKAGLIGLIQMQVKYELIPPQEGERGCSYLADFKYTDAVTGVTHVIDVKSEITRKLPTYIIKRKLMLERYNIKIKEV